MIANQTLTRHPWWLQVAQITLVGCSFVTDPAGTNSSLTTSTPAANDAGQDPPIAARAVNCTTLTAAKVGTVTDSALVEVSGLVASNRTTNDQPQNIWVHNDSDQAPALTALNLSGDQLGRFDLTGSDSIRDAETDIEDIARFGDIIYLADTGDNTASRDHVRIFVLSEPAIGDATAAAPVTATVTLRYPDGPQDAEAAFVDPQTATLYLLTKQISIDLTGDDTLLGTGEASVFSVPVDQLVDGASLEWTTVGTLDTEGLNQAATQLPAPGQAADNGLTGLITAADISADGSVIGLRTYGTVWLFDRFDGQSILEALTKPGCEAATIAEQQGEAFGFLPDTNEGTRFVTIGEGEQPPVHLTEPAQ